MTRAVGAVLLQVSLELVARRGIPVDRLVLVTHGLVGLQKLLVAPESRGRTHTAERVVSLCMRGGADKR